jgi:hypothetical protein
MENSIKELIELSTSNGSIKQESRDFIYQKAEEKRISKTECDIYIENALNVISKQDGVIKTIKSYRGWWFIMFGIGDFITGVSIGDANGAIAILAVISGALFILVGIALLLGSKLRKKIGFFLLSVVIGYLIAFIVLSPFIALKLNSLLDFVALPVYLSILFIISYIFRYKILGENASKVEILKLNTFLQPILNKLPTSVLDFLKKV